MLNENVLFFFVVVAPFFFKSIISSNNMQTRMGTGVQRLGTGTATREVLIIVWPSTEESSVVC